MAGPDELRIEGFPPELRHRLRVLAAVQKTSMRVIVIDAVERAVETREANERAREASLAIHPATGLYGSPERPDGSCPHCERPVANHPFPDCDVRGPANRSLR